VISIWKVARGTDSPEQIDLITKTMSRYEVGTSARLRTLVGRMER